MRDMSEKEMDNLNNIAVAYEGEGKHYEALKIYEKLVLLGVDNGIIYNFIDCLTLGEFKKYSRLQFFMHNYLAKNNIKESLYKIAFMYEKGIYVEKDIALAIKYYKILIDKGYEGAKIRYEKILEKEQKNDI